MIPVLQSQSLELETLLHFIRVGYGARSLQHGRDQIGGESPDSACYYPPARRRLAGLVYNCDSVVISAHMSSSEHFQIGFARSFLPRRHSPISASLCFVGILSLIITVQTSAQNES